jgi:hypothetical protein
MSTTIAWTLDSSMRALNKLPLPKDFTWPHRDGGERPVRPVHGAVIGYGKWLRETPYFPGLFELCHDLLTDAPNEIFYWWLPTQLRELRAKLEKEPKAPGESLAHMLRRRRISSNQINLF